MLDLEKAITNKQKEVERLREVVKRLSQYEDDLRALQRAKAILAGKTGSAAREHPVPARHNGRRTSPLADNIDKVLADSGGALHAAEIQRRLATKGVSTSKAVVVNTILRYVNDGKRYRRTAPNTFAQVA